MPVRNNRVGIDPMLTRARRWCNGALAAALGVIVLGAAATPVAAVGVRAEAATTRDVHALATSTSAIQAGSVDRSSIQLQARYNVAVDLRFDAGTMGVDSSMTVTNTSGAGIDRLELNSVAARLGAMRLRSVTVDGTPRTATIEDQTIHVPLGGVLPAGATATVRIAYEATFRTTTTGSNWLFAKRNGIVNAYRWLPWISRERAFTRPNFGDPFVTAVSPHVRVAITMDRAMRVATQGLRVSASGLTHTFEARNVRDFNFTASPHYLLLMSTVGGIKYRVYYRSGTPASTMMSWAKRALTRMEGLVGDYPYPVYTVAESAGGYGMESPALTWIPRGTASSSLPYLISHETAHQWFYAVVGNDQASEPFADEAPADFLARYTLGIRRGSRCSGDRLDRTIYIYSSACYYEVIYIQGGNFLDGLRGRMGNADFWAGMRDYYATYRFKLAGTAQLLRTLDRHTSLDLVPTYEPRFPRYY